MHKGKIIRKLIQMRKDEENLNKNINNFESQSSNIQELIISNAETRYKLHYGGQFSHLLEARDQVLEHEFNFKIDVSPENLHQFRNGNGYNTETYNKIVTNIKSFLVETSNNVTSIAFKFLCEQKLNQNEAKDYASKNMMINIQSILGETIKALGKLQLGQNQTQILRQTRQRLENMLIIQADFIFKTILTNLAAYYPQAPATGGTPRMRENINEINRLQDEQNDFIYANNIKISDYLQFGKQKDQNNRDYETILFQNEDYTKFIMDVVNKIIEVTQSNQGDILQRTNKQIFTSFNETAFWICQQPNYQKKINQNLTKVEEENIILEFQQIFNGNKKKKMNINRETREQQIQHIFRDQAAIQNGIQMMKQKKKHAIGQKIPGYIKEFSRQDIQNNKFTAKHSSILRILTKWTEYLEEIFENPQKTVFQRLYKFKTIRHQFFSLIEESQGKQKLVKQLKEQYKEVKLKFQSLHRSSYQLIKKYIKSEYKPESFINRYTNTRTVASKINAILTSLTLKYTNILIHHLLRAGRAIMTTHVIQIKNIDLIVFRITDLMRAKLQCSESSFIALLKTLYLLDSSEKMKDRFKIVRIKNKLDDPANNIIINYLFKGKIQCQLQLSIQEAKGKEKNYYNFSHFIYELTRGKFGAIAECAIMISQLDPMIAVVKQKYYTQNQGVRPLLSHFYSNVNSIQSKQQITSKINIYQQIYTCSKCKREVISQSNKIFQQKNTESVCNFCILQQQDVIERIKSDKIKKFIKRSIQEKIIQRIKSYSELKDIKRYQLTCGISDSGKLELYMIIKVESQIKTFKLKIDQTLLPMQDDINYSTLDSVDITKKISKSLNNSIFLKQLLFKIKLKNINNQFLQIMPFKLEVFRELNFNKIMNNFVSFRTEKNLIKNIKFKSQIINSNNFSQKWQIFNNVVEILNNQKIENSYINKEENMKKLKYKKYRQLDLASIIQIEANEVQKPLRFQFIQKFKNLKIFSFSQNCLKEISQNQLPTTITSLDLRQNQISKFDFPQLVNLTYLDLSSNQFTESINVSYYTNLKNLHLFNSKLKHIDVTKLTKLVNLYLFMNQLVEIDVSTLENLTTLDICFNQLIKIDLSNLVNLKNLYIQSNKLTQLDLSKLKNLITVFAYQNQINTLNVTSLAKLENLRASKNKLTQIFLYGLQNLNLLDLNDNLIILIRIADMLKLQSINISSNKLERIELQNLPSLTQLQLGYNALQKLDINSFLNINLLSLPRNKLQELNISNLKKISRLFCNQNNIHKLDLSNQLQLKQIVYDRAKVIELIIDCSLTKKISFEMKQLKTLVVYYPKNVQPPQRDQFKHLRQDAILDLQQRI